MKKQTFTALTSMILCANAARAEDFPPSEDFSAEIGSAVSSADKAKTETDSTEFGGRLRVEATSTVQNNQKIRDATTSNGSGAELYIDAKTANGGRAFLRAQVAQSAGNATPSVSLDEAKVQLTLAQKWFLTGGRQKIKFGSAKFFNPTDFLNQVSRDPFALDDRRPGIDGLKLHVPMEGTNLYAFLLSPQTQKFGDTGAYARGEFAFSKGEFSLSALQMREKNTRIGADCSIAIWDVDVFAEAAWNGEARASGGMMYELKFNDTDTAAFTGEYFYNEPGLRNKSHYLPALNSGTHRLLNLGKHYGAGSIYLAKPKAFSKTTFLASTIANFSDGSYTIVPQVFYEVTKDITASVAAQIPKGQQGSEFKLSRAKGRGTLALEAVF